jgi:hypothetical protein
VSAAAEPKQRRALVFDIETIADLTAENRDAIAALATPRDMTPEAYAGLCPPLARVACVAWCDVAAQRVGAFFDATLLRGAAPASIQIDGGSGTPQPPLECALHACTDEAHLLRAFGCLVEEHLRAAGGQLVTYNGRGFDLPVLIHRSIKHRVSEGRELLIKAATENRYRPMLHLDLMEVVTFSGVSARWPLAAYAIGYGFASPKSTMDGSQVWSAVQAGRIIDVARYCAGDVLATAHVHRVLQERLPPAASQPTASSSP